MSDSNAEPLPVEVISVMLKQLGILVEMPVLHAMVGHLSHVTSCVGCSESFTIEEAHTAGVITGILFVLDPKSRVVETMCEDHRSLFVQRLRSAPRGQAS